MMIYLLNISVHKDSLFISCQYISLYTNKAGHLGSRFEKLVRLVSQQLTPQTYNMIIYVQVSHLNTDHMATR